MTILASLLAAAGLFAASPVHATLTAPTHSPKVDTNWRYTVRVTDHGKPAAGLITVQIVDPLGGVHAVQYGKTTRNVTRRPFRGVFRDFVIWPPSSRGIPVTFRVTVTVGKARTVLRYTVTARG
jgi:hypothetical protein